MLGGGLGPWEMVVIVVIILVLFGAGKLPKVMGDVAKGLKSFRTELFRKDVITDEDDE